MKRTSPTISCQRSSRPRRGFTLLEALIATTILTLGVVALSDVLIATYSAESSIRRQEQAISLGKELLEQIVAKPTRDESMPSAMPASDAVPMTEASGGTELPPSNTGMSNDDMFRTSAAFNEMPTIESTDGMSDTIDADVPDEDPAAGTYSRRVEVVRVKEPDGDPDPNGNLTRIDVVVTDPLGHEHRISRLVMPVSVRYSD